MIPKKLREPVMLFAGLAALVAVLLVFAGIYASRQPKEIKGTYCSGGENALYLALYADGNASLYRQFQQTENGTYSVSEAAEGVLLTLKTEDHPQVKMIFDQKDTVHIIGGWTENLELTRIGDTPLYINVADDIG